MGNVLVSSVRGPRPLATGRSTTRGHGVAPATYGSRRVPTVARVPLEDRGRVLAMAAFATDPHGCAGPPPITDTCAGVPCLVPARAVLAGLLGFAAWWGIAVPEPTTRGQGEPRESPEVQARSATRPASYVLHWSAPPGCPEAEVIRELVAAAAGELEGGLGILEVEAIVEPRDGTFGLVLETTYFERHDVRTVESPDCSDLAGSVALVIAIALDPNLRSEATEPSPPPTSIPDPSAPAKPHASAPERPPAQSRPASEATKRSPGRGAASRHGGATTPSPTSRSRPRAAPEAWVVRAAAQFEYGRLPPFGGGTELAVGVAWPRWRLEAYGSYLWPRRRLDPQGTGGLYQFGAAGVRACWRPWAGTVEFPLCLGVEGGGVHVESRGLEPRTRLRGRWLAPTAAAGVVVGHGRVYFWSLLEAAPLILGSRFSVGDQVVFAPEPVAARLLAGLELRFAIESGGRGQGTER